MKKLYQWTFLTAIMIVAAASASLAQDPNEPFSPHYNPKSTYNGPYKLNTWSLTAQIGPSLFLGDLREYDFMPVTKNSETLRNELGLQGGIGVGKQLSYLFGVRSDVTFGGLRGMKSRNYGRYFVGNFVDWSIAGSVNLSGLLFGSNKFKRWKIDAFGGIGTVWYKANAFLLEDRSLIRTTDGTRNDWMVPIGLGINYEVSKRWDIGLQFRTSIANSDYLDATYGGDYSTNPSDGFLISNQPISRRGNSALDQYGHVAFSVTFKLGKMPLRAVKRDGKFVYDTDQEGFYNLRYTDPSLLLSGPKILTIGEMDSIAKANRPEDIDPKLLLDSDGDGVSDYFDKEENSTTGNLVDGSGRTIDFDNYVKRAISAGVTCSELFTNVTFEVDSTIIYPEFKEMLNGVAQLMNKNGCRLQLTGHADITGAIGHNMDLSRRRVEVVRNYLVNEAGVENPENILVDSFGAFKPIADGASNEGLKKNRRVELRLMP